MRCETFLCPLAFDWMHTHARARSILRQTLRKRQNKNAPSETKRENIEFSQFVAFLFFSFSRFSFGFHFANVVCVCFFSLSLESNVIKWKKKWINDNVDVSVCCCCFSFSFSCRRRHQAGCLCMQCVSHCMHKSKCCRQTIATKKKNVRGKSKLAIIEAKQHFVRPFIRPFFIFVFLFCKRRQGKRALTFHAISIDNIHVLRLSNEVCSAFRWNVKLTQTVLPFRFPLTNWTKTKKNFVLFSRYHLLVIFIDSNILWNGLWSVDVTMSAARWEMCRRQVSF